MSDQSSSEERISRAELVRRIEQEYAALQETLRPLSEAQLALPRQSGWAIKDHLAHLAAWEEGISELLQRRPRFPDPDIEEAEVQGKGEDEINAIIYRKHAALSPAQALEKFNAAHREMLRVLNSLSDEDLYKPYAAYLPDGDGPQAPVVNWIDGNTYGHYEEHHRWIREQIAGE